MAKIVTAVVLTALIVGGILGYMLAQNCAKTRELLALAEKQSADAFIKGQVETAVSMLQALSDQQKAGEISVAKAQELGANLLRELRYGQDGYFWADTKDGVNVVLYGNKDVEGKNRYEANANGVYYVKEIIKNGMQAGGGFTDYFYTKMGGEEMLAKRTYSLYFEPFDWVVGTGYYLEDVK
ncbi:MAG: cache domain-containing protein [Patescibacteria group bacterium]|nr:cache domain-containing protein [Patescibacteria group bacterium]MDD5490641.1 cache domain-containing protein [Patescibacteria group bacterium]